MTIRESVIKEIDTLPNEALYAVRDFLLFQKHRDILEMDDTTYLNSIPGMKESIIAGMKENIEDCAATIEW